MKTSIISFALLFLSATNVLAQEVHVFASYQQSIAWMESIGWWGEDLRAEQIRVPRTLLIAISPAWRESAAQMPVATKKEFFYRCLLPLLATAGYACQLAGPATPGLPDGAQGGTGERPKA
jgi:hypothetical protein